MQVTTKGRKAARALALISEAQFIRYFMVLTVLAAIALWPGMAGARSAPESFADLAEELLPMVVNIATTQVVEPGQGPGDFEEFFKEFFERRGEGRPPQQPQHPPQQQQRRASSLGSGFIIDSSGYVVTNNHVIAGADEITVRLYDNTTLKAVLVGTDKKTDLALLKVESDKPLPATKWGQSDKTRIGDWVIAIGNPFGFGGSVTAGIISARHRDINAGPYDNFIQTDAAINKGNSGGPMFNIHGEVIGVNTAIISPSGGSIGIGFAIPSQQVKNVIDQLREHGEVRRGWLGVKIQTVTDDIAEGLRLDKPIGALVASVTEGGPAEKAGIAQGDVIIKFDNRVVENMRKLPGMVADTPIGKDVDVVVWRKGKEVAVKVNLGALEEAVVAAASETPESAAPADESGELPILGLVVGEITPALREQFQLDEDAKGVVITKVDETGPAAEKNLRPGDVIVEVDQEDVRVPNDVAEKIEKAKSEGYRVVTLLVFRQGDFQWVAVRLGKG